MWLRKQNNEKNNWKNNGNQNRDDNEWDIHVAVDNDQKKKNNKKNNCENNWNKSQDDNIDAVAHNDNNIKNARFRQSQGPQSGSEQPWIET